MESAYLRNPWRSPAMPRYYSPAARGVPLRSAKTESPKVVSIPVRFVANQRERSAAAVKIQSGFKGFAVRKNVRKIARVAAEADRLGQAISRRETVRLLQGDPKEKLKMTESMMSLLFQLDSVRGVDSGVRDLRKAVTRRVIALQEAVDALSSQEKHAETEEVPEAGGDESKEGSICEDDGTDETLDVLDNGVDVCGAEGTTEQTREVQDRGGMCPDLADGNLAEELIEESRDRKDLQQCNSDLMEETLENQESDRKEGVCKRSREQVDESSPQVVGKTLESLQKEGSEGPKRVDAEEGVETKDAMEIPVIDSTVRPAKSATAQGNQTSVSEGSIERVVAENEKLRSLIADLCERNVVQSRLMSSLAERVEQLEKVVRQQEQKKKMKKKQKLTANAAKSRMP